MEGEDVEMGEGRKFCGNCGQPLASGDSFCGACGQAVEDAPAARASVTPIHAPAPEPVDAKPRTRSKPKRPKRRRWWLACLIILLLAPGVIAIVWLQTSERARLALSLWWGDVTAGRPGGVTAVAIDAENRLVGAGTNNGMFLVWDLKTGKRIERMGVFVPPRVEAVAFSTGEDGLGGSMQVGLGHSHGLNVIAWSLRNPRGQRILSVLELGRAGDLGTQKSITFKPGGATVVSADLEGGVVRFWDTATGEQFRPIRMAPGQILASMAVSHDVRFYAQALGDASVEIWDLWGGRRSRVCVLKSDRSDPMISIAVNPEGQLVAGADGSDRIILWDTGTAQVLRSLTTPSGASCVVFSDDGGLVAGAGDGFITIWNTANGGELRTIQVK